MPIEITFQLSLRDVYRSNAAIMTGNLRWFFWPLSLICLIPIAGIAFALVAKTMGLSVPIGFAGLWGSLFLPTFLLYLRFGAPYFAARTLFKNNANLKAAIHYSISEDLVIQEMATGRAELRWSTFVRVREAPDLFLLYVQKQLAHPIPKRAYTSAQELSAFRDIVRRQVPRAELRG
ncbi:MAG TPA: YcxB family protein [Candidatus Acidoferrum sp.]|nr:YcxB family protein [Candidatus Acidoferrum sp.]